MKVIIDIQAKINEISEERQANCLDLVKVLVDEYQMHKFKKIHGIQKKAKNQQNSNNS